MDIMRRCGSSESVFNGSDGLVFCMVRYTISPKGYRKPLRLVQ